MMSLGELLEQQNLSDAIVSLVEVRVPLVVGELDIYEGTWKGLPINLKDTGQLFEIVGSLTDNEVGFLKLAALLVNWGRTYEIRRLLKASPVGNLSAAITVIDNGANDADDAPHGDSTGERSDNNN